jgi:hypothetical protein
MLLVIRQDDEVLHGIQQLAPAQTPGRRKSALKIAGRAMQDQHSITHPAA